MKICSYANLVETLVTSIWELNAALSISLQSGHSHSLYPESREQHSCRYVFHISYTVRKVFEYLLIRIAWGT